MVDGFFDKILGGIDGHFYQYNFMNAVNPREDAGIIGWWGLDPELAERAPGLIDFLDKSENLRNMAGLYGSVSDGSLRQLIPYDENNHPLIKVDGVMRTWEDLQGLFDSVRINPDSATYLKTRVVGRDDGRVWRYISSERGFVPDPGETGEVVSVHRLSGDERTALLAHALQFNEAHPELEEEDPGEKTCVFQITTVIDDSSEYFLRNFYDTIGTNHVGMTVVDENGEVYSFGTHAEMRTLFKSSFNVCGTINSEIQIPDWELFREHEEGKVRRVTSMAITATRARELLEYIKELNQTGVSFNFLQQNCSTIAVGFVKKATGAVIDQCITMGQYFYRLLPDLSQIPIIGWPLDKIYKVAVAIFDFVVWITPWPITWLIGKVTMIVLYIPNKIITVMQNFAILIFGGARSLKESEGEEEPLTSEPKIHQFSSIIRSPLDLFNDEVSTIHLPAKVLEWQKEQPSTVEYRTTFPQLCVVPES